MTRDEIASSFDAEHKCSGIERLGLRLFRDDLWGGEDNDEYFCGFFWYVVPVDKKTGYCTRHKLPATYCPGCGQELSSGWGPEQEEQALMVRGMTRVSAKAMIAKRAEGR